MSNLDVEFFESDDFDPDLKKVLEANAVEIQVNNDFRALSLLLESRRNDCHKRGYHRISQDKPVDTGVFVNDRFCYDCEVIFDKDSIDYKVEPH